MVLGQVLIFKGAFPPIVMLPAQELWTECTDECVMELRTKCDVGDEAMASRAVWDAANRCTMSVVKPYVVHKDICSVIFDAHLTGKLKVTNAAALTMSAWKLHCRLRQ